MDRRLKAFGIAVILMIGASAPARASCTGAPLVTALPIAFLFYNPGSDDLKINGSVTVACLVPLLDSLPSFTIAVSSGSAGGGFEPRTMAPTLGAIPLEYNIYTGSDYGTIWGNGSGATQTQSYGGGGTSKTFTAYGKIPQGQFANAVLYTATVMVTVTY